VEQAGRRAGRDLQRAGDAQGELLAQRAVAAGVTDLHQAQAVVAQQHGQQERGLALCIGEIEPRGGAAVLLGEDDFAPLDVQPGGQGLCQSGRIGIAAQAQRFQHAGADDGHRHTAVVDIHQPIADFDLPATGMAEPEGAVLRDVGLQQTILGQDRRGRDQQQRQRRQPNPTRSGRHHHASRIPLAAG